ncbi:hypothetical protein YC2023_043636 [Brassica napus]
MLTYAILTDSTFPEDLLSMTSFPEDLLSSPFSLTKVRCLGVFFIPGDRRVPLGGRRSLFSLLLLLCFSCLSPCSPSILVSRQRMSSAGILLRVWRCVSLRATFIGFVSAALVGLDLAVRGSRVSSAPLRNLVAGRVGVVVSCCVEFILACEISRYSPKSEWVRRGGALHSGLSLLQWLFIPEEVCPSDPVALYGLWVKGMYTVSVRWVGGSNLQQTSPNEGIVGCGLLLVLPVSCVFQGLRAPFSPVCLWQLRPLSALASPRVLHCFVGARLRTWFLLFLLRSLLLLDALFRFLYCTLLLVPFVPSVKN